MGEMEEMIAGLKDMVGVVSNAMQKMSAMDTPRHGFIKDGFLRQSLYNSDEEASEHDISTELGRLLVMAGL
jgi:hypothetical protein